MALWDVTIRKQLKNAVRNEKAIGRGGPVTIFSNEVQPLTRSIRIILAICRAWEARVDGRFYEVGLAEGL
jgi:hypothetical protein